MGRTQPQQTGRASCRERTRGGGMSGAATFAHDHVFPAENDPSWRNNAACLGVDSNVFFPGRGAKGTEAKQICGGCPVREECLEYALRTRPVYGIWGGLNHN